MTRSPSAYRVASRYLTAEVRGIGTRWENKGDRIQYEGLTIINEDGLDDATVRHMLNAIDHLFAVFRKRSVDKALTSTLSGIVLRYGLTSGGGHGQYQWGWLDMSAEAVMEGSNWLNRTFMHEIGHHIFAELPHRAQEEWRGAWREDDIAEATRTTAHITGNERVRFFNLIGKSGWDLQKAGRKLKGVDRIKFLWWLHSPGGGGSNPPLITNPRRMRLTHEGRRFQGFFGEVYERVKARDPEKAEDERQHWLLWLGVNAVWRNSDAPLPPEAVEQIRELEALPTRGDLEFPTEYASANYQEDFAETFVEFMLKPHSLSKIPTYRMQRTLSLAGLYGKQVMRLGGSVRGAGR